MKWDAMKRHVFTFHRREIRSRLQLRTRTGHDRTGQDRSGQCFELCRCKGGAAAAAEEEQKRQKGRRKLKTLARKFFSSLCVPISFNVPYALPPLTISFTGSQPSSTKTIRAEKIVKHSRKQQKKNHRVCCYSIRLSIPIKRKKNNTHC